MLRMNAKISGYNVKNLNFILIYNNCYAVSTHNELKSKASLRIDISKLVVQVELMI